MLGYNISLSCPVGSATNHSRRSVQDWYRGNVSNPGAMIARLITKGLRVEYNYTINKKKWIITMAGELFIQKLTLEDAGFYICRFTGSGAQAIELHVEGVFDCFYLDVSQLSKLTMTKLIENVAKLVLVTGSNISI